MLWVEVFRIVLNLHVVVLHIDQGVVVLVEEIELAVFKGETSVDGRVDTHTAWEVVQVEEHFVPQVENPRVGIYLEEFFLVRTDQLAQASKFVCCRAKCFIFKVIFVLEHRVSQAHDIFCENFRLLQI